MRVIRGKSRLKSVHFIVGEPKTRTALKIESRAVLDRSKDFFFLDRVNKCGIQSQHFNLYKHLTAVSPCQKKNPTAVSPIENKNNISNQEHILLRQARIRVALPTTLTHETISESDLKDTMQEISSKTSTISEAGRESNNTR